MGSAPLEHSTWPVRRASRSPSERETSGAHDPVDTLIACTVRGTVVGMDQLLELAAFLEPSIAPEEQGPEREPSGDDVGSGADEAAPTDPPPTLPRPPRAAAGDVRLGMKLLEPLPLASPFTSWRVRADDGRQFALHSVPPSAPPVCRSAFERNASLLEELNERNISGVVRVVARSEDGGAYATELEPLGTALDVPVLGWSLRDRLSFFERVCSLFDAIHREGVCVGGWWPGDVALDDDLHPVLTRVVGVPASALEGKHVAPELQRYLAPELLSGETAHPSTDVFALGRLLHFLLSGEHPPAIRESLPRLAELSAQPAGLARIVRKCCAQAAYLRYRTVSELMADLGRYGEHTQVGLPHPDAAEQNLTGLSNPALPSKKKQVAAPPAAPRSAPRPSRREPAVTSRRLGASPRLLVFAGIWLVGACAAGGLLGGAATAVTALATVMPLCAVLIALGLPTSAERPIVGRVAFGLGAATLLYLVDPVVFVADLMDQQRFDRGDVTARTKQLRLWLQAGRRDFPGASLAGAQLAHLDLAHAGLAGADLRGADLSGADLGGADLSAAQLDGAKLEGAMLAGAVWDGSRGLEHASCDGATVMHDGWACVEGHPQVAGKGGSEPSDNDPLE